MIYFQNWIILVTNIFYSADKSPVHLNNFDPDWESTQSDSRLPLGLQYESTRYSSQGSKTPSNAYCKPLASSSSKRSKLEVYRNESDPSESMYRSCNQILEEVDEESVNNLTPRLSEDIEKEANLLEETSSNNQLCNSDDIFTKDKMYQTKTTTETEEDTEFNKCDDSSDSFILEKNENENPLSLSIISLGEMSIEERFVSPSATTSSSKMPLFSVNKARKSFGLNSLNTSVASTAGYSVNDSKIEKRFSDSPSGAFCKKSLNSILSKGCDDKPIHLKNNLSHGKPATNKKLIHSLKNTNDQYYSTILKHMRTNSSTKSVSWKDKESKSDKKNCFTNDHWDFNKKEGAQKPNTSARAYPTTT